MRRRVFGALSMAACVGVVAPDAGAQAFGVEYAKLLSVLGEAGDNAGVSVAVGAGVVAMGASFSDAPLLNSGRVLMFDAASGAPTLIIAHPDPEFNALFGTSVAIDGDLLLVGSPLQDSGDTEAGRVYAFDSQTGVPGLVLDAPDGMAMDNFGWSCDASCGLIVVGALRADGAEPDSGAVYVFSERTGAFVRKIEAVDGETGDQFGRSVAIENGIVAVGAPARFVNGEQSGAAYLFDANTGEQLGFATPSDAPSGAQFGFAVDVGGGVLAVGAYEAPSGPGTGAVYVYPVDAPSSETKIEAESAVTGIGFSVALDGGVLVAGAPFDDALSAEAGASVVFDVETGAELAVLLSSDGADGDSFGRSVAIGGGVIAVGAIGDDDFGFSSGAAYLFGGEPEDPCENDIDGSGVVDLADLLSVLAAFGAPCD